MKNILQIIKKELLRFFKDRRLVISVLLPGLMIFILYSFLGDAIGNLNTVDNSYVFQVALVGEVPSDIEVSLEAMEFKVDFEKITASEIDDYKTQIEAKELDALLVVPDNFTLTSGGEIQIFYNATRKESAQAYSTLNAVFDAFNTRTFGVNTQLDVKYDLSSEQDVAAMAISMMLPFLIITFLFSGCLAVTPESIAGEKERGTIATLLVTPIKRSELAIGKIVSLSIIALLSALSSAIGAFASLPKMMQAAGEIKIQYQVGDYVAILFVIMAAVLLIVSLMAVISTFAKSVKEANTLVMPLMIVMMLVGISSMLGIEFSGFYFYLIPIFNVVQVLTAIFANEMSIVNVLITIGSLLVYTLIFVFILVKMFNNEKVIFNK